MYVLHTNAYTSDIRTPTPVTLDIGSFACSREPSSRSFLFPLRGTSSRSRQLVRNSPKSCQTHLAACHCSSHCRLKHNYPCHGSFGGGLKSATCSHAREFQAPPPKGTFRVSDPSKTAIIYHFHFTASLCLPTRSFVITKLQNHFTKLDYDLTVKV